MKKLNLFIAVTLVAASSIFTSCKKDDTVTNFPIIDNFTANKTTVTESGDTVTIAIKVSPGDKNIKYITILSSKTGGAAYDVALGKSWTGDKTAAGYWDKDGIYTTTATFIVPDGGATYTCTAYDTEGNAGTASKSQTITIASSEIPVTSPAFTTASTAAQTTIACYLGDGSSNSCYANSTGTLYSVNGVSSNYKIIDFIYYDNVVNNVGSYGIYSPSAFKNLDATGNVANWGSLNATTFAKVQLDPATATVDDVTNAATAATATSVTGLSIGDVVVFKVANTNSSIPGRIGIFKVTDITKTGTKSDYQSGAYVKITVWLKNS